MQVLTYWIMLRLLTWPQTCILKERIHRNVCFSHIYIQTVFVIKLALGCNFVCLSWVVWDLGGKMGIRWKWYLSRKFLNCSEFIMSTHWDVWSDLRELGQTCWRGCFLLFFLSFLNSVKDKPFMNFRCLPLSDWKAFGLSRFIILSWVLCLHFLQVSKN